MGRVGSMLSYDKSGAGWQPLPDLPTSDTAASLYDFTEYAAACRVPAIIRLGAGEKAGRAVLEYQVFVPAEALDAWERATTEFLRNARTRKTLPISGVRMVKLIELFADQLEEE